MKNNNSNEFVLLQKLIKENKVELRLKKILKDSFGVWLYWYSETKLKSKGLVYFYWFISSEWLWIPLAIIISIKTNYFYLLLIIVPFIITKIFKPIGEGFMIYDAKNNEALFQELWDNKFIGIFSMEKGESLIFKDGGPKFIIDSYRDNWRDEIIKYETKQ